MAGANIKSKDSYVYFLHSEQQRAERTRVERTMSRTFNPGTVVVNGRRENFTEISKSTTNRYPDCKVVAQGIKSKMVYTPISIT